MRPNTSAGRVRFGYTRPPSGTPWQWMMVWSIGSPLMKVPTSRAPNAHSRVSYSRKVTASANLHRGERIVGQFTASLIDAQGVYRIVRRLINPPLNHYNGPLSTPMPIRGSGCERQSANGIPGRLRIDLTGFPPLSLDIMITRFVSGALSSSRTSRCLTVVDEICRECLVILASHLSSGRAHPRSYRAAQRRMGVARGRGHGKWQ